MVQWDKTRQSRSVNFPTILRYPISFHRYIRISSAVAPCCPMKRTYWAIVYCPTVPFRPTLIKSTCLPKILGAHGRGVSARCRVYIPKYVALSCEVYVSVSADSRVPRLRAHITALTVLPLHIYTYTHTYIHMYVYLIP